VGTLVACAALAVTASSALAKRDRDRDSYTVNITPATAPAGTSTTFDVALTNTSSPRSGLSSAVLIPPFGFKVTHASLPSGAKGHAHVRFNAVFLNALSVAPDSTLHVSVTATARAGCHNFFNRWLTDANEHGFGSENLILDVAHSRVTTDVTCVTGTALKFATQPNDTLVDDNITGNQYDTSGPPLTVDIVDSGGNVVDSSAPVTIALHDNPGGAKLSGTLTRNAVHGVATFDDLTLDKPDNGYTLTASSSGLTGATSSSFDENNTVTNCPANAACSGTLSTPFSSITVDVGSGPEAAILTESVDVGTEQHCDGYAPPDASRDWYEFVVSQSDRSKTLTWTVNDASPEGFAVCFGAPYEFQYINPSTGATGQAPAGTLPDGSPGFVGVLNSCDEFSEGDPTPCVVSILGTENGGTQAIVRIPAGNEGDPWPGR
jgi:hypothetical protein